MTDLADSVDARQFPGAVLAKQWEGGQGRHPCNIVCQLPPSCRIHPSSGLITATAAAPPVRTNQVPKQFVTANRVHGPNKSLRGSEGVGVRERERERKRKRNWEDEEDKLVKTFAVKSFD